MPHLIHLEQMYTQKLNCIHMYIPNTCKSFQMLKSVLCIDVLVWVNAVTVAMPLEVTWPFPQCPRLGWRISSRVVMGMVGSYSYLWTSESNVSSYLYLE